MFKPILAGRKNNFVSFPLAFQHGLGGRGLVPAGAGKSALVNDQPKTAIAQRNDLGSAPVVGVITLIRVIRAGSFHGEQGGSFWLFFFGLGLGGLLGGSDGTGRQTESEEERFWNFHDAINAQ